MTSNLEQACNQIQAAIRERIALLAGNYDAQKEWDYKSMTLTMLLEKAQDYPHSGYPKALRRELIQLASALLVNIDRSK